MAVSQEYAEFKPLPGESWDDFCTRRRSHFRGRIWGVPSVRVRRALNGADGSGRDYREDLSRFPGDPQAYVDGPRSLQRLIDQRKREGWVEREQTVSDLISDLDSSKSASEISNEEHLAMVQEAFTEAKAAVQKGEDE